LQGITILKLVGGNIALENAIMRTKADIKRCASFVARNYTEPLLQSSTQKAASFSVQSLAKLNGVTRNL